MSIHTAWDNPDKSVIHILFDGEWGGEDLADAVYRADAMIISVGHRVDLIIDMSSSSHIPRDFLSIARDMLDSGQPRPNEGQRVVVGLNGFLRTLYHTAHRALNGRLEGREVLFATSIDEARELLASMELDES